MAPTIIVPARRKMLVADDEADIHAVTRMSLSDLVPDQDVEFVSAVSGRQAVEGMRGQPDIGVVLLDVAIGDQHAGLEAIDEVRAPAADERAQGYVLACASRPRTSCTLDA